MATKGGAPSVMTKFLGLLRNYAQPVTDAEVRDYFKSENGGGYEQLPDVINSLLSEGKIKIFKKGSVLSYGIEDPRTHVRAMSGVFDADWHPGSGGIDALLLG